MLKSSLPSTYPVCALERGAPAHAVREILAPLQGPIDFSGAGFLKRTEMFLHTVL